ncbi:[FeFe] hydrogenase H-cluster maturation GTPase HydF [Petrocella sp. FN5]|uniref:[FeFe] hydrogenase H-cluster maturation GTPase HydF n=1 Tax=Petrocella sp. FN5 TaxID=3032002 RepID=UPI0023DC7071|nr:[FeFe] hydrogenase H-cluster maturation GTPase HydF [Petrocella sp. FN5]MDF1616456.1 [FeFe] hydrogenase H-cluster maturation GTPase HydF [Petrocella sp. FN5]
MSLNQTPQSNRIHIAFFGQTNAGKSSLINAVTQQDIALVSEVRGTTTDPVYKAMELLPLGPVMLIDTAGLNDTTGLGTLRKQKTLEVLNKTDLAVLVIDGLQSSFEFEKKLIETIHNKKVPLIGVINKMDLTALDVSRQEALSKDLGIPIYPVSSVTKEGIKELKIAMSQALPLDEDAFRIVGDLVHPGDFVVLVTPIDKAAPKGRLILPQQQTIRDILESDAIAIVCKEHELRETLDRLGTKPQLVITDSQAFLKVAADTPKDILMTSFSILFARHKGDLLQLVKGAKAIEALKDGDKVLISEGCTHHRQSDDIGSVKIPRWLKQLTGKQLHFDYVSGVSFTDSAKDYALIIHCGACMLNKKAMAHRLETVETLQVPIVNYGVMIAYVHGILDRALEPFPLAKMIWDEVN